MLDSKVSQSGSRTRDLRVSSANPSLFRQLTLLTSKIFPSPGVEPGPCVWEAQIVTARPTGTGTVHSSILNSDAHVGRLFCCIAVDFQLIKGLAGLQIFSQSGSRTRDLRVGLECEISKSQFNVSTDTAPVQNLPQSGSRTRDLWVKATNPNR